MRCQGYKYGTFCKKTTKNTDAPNWERQLCYNCDNMINPELYKDKQKHGVGGTWMKTPDCSSMITQ